LVILWQRIIDESVNEVYTPPCLEGLERFGGAASTSGFAHRNTVLR